VLNKIEGKLLTHLDTIAEFRKENKFNMHFYKNQGAIKNVDWHLCVAQAQSLYHIDMPTHMFLITPQLSTDSISENISYLATNTIK
jgi:hypothetical protein